MKKLLFHIFLLLGIGAFAQDEIKMPELDTGNQVYTLEFSPDSQNEKVISSYMQGETEKDSLRFWAEGTTLLQKIMVTVISDKNADIKVDIVKDNWKDSKINGHTKNGLFQESFETAGKFGIVITSTIPNISFQLAVWTNGENIPYMGNLYYPANEAAATRSGQVFNASNSISQPQNESGTGGTNTILYVVIGFFSIITILLVLLLIKKKSAKTLLILLCFSLGQQIGTAGASPSLSEVFTESLKFIYENHDGIEDFFNRANSVVNEFTRRLSPDDDDAQADPRGGPQLPSSCIPPQFGTNRNGADSGNSNSPRQGSSNSSNTDSSYEPLTTNSSNSNSDNNDEQNIDYDELNSLGQPVYDRNNQPIEYPVFTNEELPKYDINGDPIQYREPVHNNELDYFERPVYDRNNERIDYPVFGDDKRPKYDINGNPIQYAEGETESRPALDANKKPIEYDNYKRPKYDNKGNPINYHKDDFVNPPKRNKENNFPVDENENPEKTKIKTNKSNDMPLVLSKSIKLINAIDGNLNTLKFKNADYKVTYAEANILGAISTFIPNENDNEAGCACLEKEYDNLNNRRLNLERLRVIYSHAMKKINAGIAFGDDVSAVHGVSGLAWQSQKMIILTKSIPTLNKAYDDKYAEMIHALEENLRAIEQCESMLGYDNWYNHAGFIYFQFMADKYKRQ
ncbi:hypothetical protein [Maribacter hydrothermalis]|uniref:Uncharacterized protein n=1 Tax=Maribacter hydrothermalis TaxID=1836467 RepID=A0A1B7ZEV3_9FLAO|nr:hypothetical protein [Maribacter hydrothermalis]APQ17603.1 hypothetical protein BTR34_09795 [Maribacter hydrothermalis]OBR42078.1 hypothetical protein A9200_01425 [Maribacter hydrothermalis]